MTENIDKTNVDSGLTIKFSDEDDKPVWEEIQKVIFQEKETAKPKTYFLTGNILEKLKQRVNKKESIIGGKTYKVESYGQIFYRLKINAGTQERPDIHYVWAYKNVLDDPEED
ncbi:1997_t:CDS:2 [Racocetra persica]|uniref:1997_t:CDS:1 n=1 Tax=Racocetra persica TaxID=160502 RepID=A0ACA9R7R1_9GLOM|nr:1997_t:CDS:2 [Racocetra persica]